MEALGLGEVEDFPFLDPPDRRQVRDGDRAPARARRARPRRRQPGKRLTRARPPARAAARRPAPRADGARSRPPRLRRRGHRHRRGAVDPGPARAPARGARARPTSSTRASRTSVSDFIGFLNLWRYLRDAAARAVGQPVPQALQGRVPALPARPRVAGPRRPAALGGARRRRHDQRRARRCRSRSTRALLAGLLSHVGLRNVEPARVRGRARGALCDLARLGARAQAAVVGHGRRAHGDVAPVGAHRGADPAVVDRAARQAPAQVHLRDAALGAQARLGRRDRARDAVRRCRSSRARKVAYGAIDPELSRELFIRCALVEGDWETRHAFVAENARVLEELEELEHRARRRDILAGDEAIFAFYDARIPDDVVSVAHFDRWWKDARRTRPAAADASRASCSSTRRRADLLDPRARPDSWRQGDLELALSYRFEPGDAHDGVTVAGPAARALAAAARPASTGSCRGCATSSSSRSSARCRRTCGARSCRSPSSPPRSSRGLRPRRGRDRRRGRARARAPARGAGEPRPTSTSRACRRTCA